ncbi:hypothetical protein SAY87_018169 [Trapa incisa]|uniref:Uncharacterized protein n=1 Tax=Trapa incisa TaxID=236973 RepID=A0AAN7LBM9_9MYRT|nr:hypothetical protein SAY87_018169 [Trapa incisa]
MICASASSERRRPSPRRRSSSTSGWWTPLFQWSSEPDYIDSKAEKAGQSVEPDQKSGSIWFALGCFTEERAKLLRMATADFGVRPCTTPPSGLAWRRTSGWKSRTCDGGIISEMLYIDWGEPELHSRRLNQITEMIPPQLRFLGRGAAIILGGLISINIVSAVTISAVRSVTEMKRKKISLPCIVCKGKGFYICKLCGGNAAIQWSPLYDPVAINPCVCPTCEGNRIQRCLNCLGKGYYC